MRGEKCNYNELQKTFWLWSFDLGGSVYSRDGTICLWSDRINLGDYFTTDCRRRYGLLSRKMDGAWLGNRSFKIFRELGCYRRCFGYDFNRSLYRLGILQQLERFGYLRFDYFCASFGG